MKITTKKSIAMKVNTFLHALEKKKWGIDNYICWERISIPMNENYSEIRVIGVELSAYSESCSSYAEDVIRFKQIQVGKDVPRRIVYYENEMDDSVINRKDAYNILVNKISSFFDEYVFEETIAYEN